MEHIQDVLYGQGFLAGVQCFDKVLTGVLYDCKRFKIKFNANVLYKISVLLQMNSAHMRNHPEAFVRYNNSKKEWEIYTPQ